MSKIFRLHNGATNNIEDWSVTGHLSEHMIDSIKDPNGGISAKQVTSIPSPFARMDLMRTAFKQIVTAGKPEGLSTYHKMVSDCLDVAEIFFNIDALKEQVEIISWDAGISYNGTDIVINSSSDLGKLLNSAHEGHRLLGESLSLFIRQDTEAFNFDKLQRIYLLNYTGGGKGLMNIIGGTSPTTMFFASANDLAGVVNLSFGAARLFDNHYTPLYKRDPDFIKYIYSIKNFFPQFAGRFKELNEYLELSFGYLPEDLKHSIKRMDAGIIVDEFQDIPMHHAGFLVEVLGERLKCNRPQPEKIEKSSDFVIAATRRDAAPLPLVLPNIDFNEPLCYVKGEWKSSFRAPFYDKRPLEERTLPHLSYIRYPYLTVDDILEPCLIRLPYPVNKEKYFTGYINSGNSGFAIPLKNEFFRYFSIDDLRNKHLDGKRWFEMQLRPDGSVEVVARIPVKGNSYIVFRRTYADRSYSSTGSRENNEGFITDCLVSLTSFPFFKTGRQQTAHYRVLLLDADQQDKELGTDISLQFYREGSEGSLDEIDIASVRDRSGKKEGKVTARCYSLQKEFDFIRLQQTNGVKGIMIPLFELIPAGACEFTFAVDFGTTNTHIEYRVDKGAPRPFEITLQDMQVGCTVSDDGATDRILREHKNGEQIALLKDLVAVDFLPSEIGKSANYRFPVRTAVSGRKLIDVNQPTYALADFIIPFAYEKASSPAHIKVTPNLKWSDFKNDPDRKRCAEAFIEELLLLMRNKILLNGGNPDATRIIWFYPSSMSEYNRNMLEQAWHSFSRKYISPAARVHKLSESVAPFYYFRHKEGVLAYEKPVVNIDIGGGTTDIVIYKENLPVCSTSFRYAANAIFGDGYGNSPLVNGFIQKYYPLIKEKLISNELYHLVTVMEQIRESDASDELVDFFFSLENNRTIAEGNYPISFSHDLKHDEDFKLVFLFFYASIIYHLAKLMKGKDMQPPRYLLFSGMGSKVINLIDTSLGLKNLQEYTNLIFRDIYRLKDLNIELRQYEEPKEITCKGGLLCDHFTDTDSIKSVLVGSREDHFVEARTLRYSQIEDRSLLSSVAEEVSEFIDKFFAGNDIFYYPKKFGVNPIGFAAQKHLLKEDMMQYLIAGIKGKLAEEKENMEQPLEETMFFYALRGIVHRLAQQSPRLHQSIERVMV